MKYFKEKILDLRPVRISNIVLLSRDQAVHFNMSTKHTVAPAQAIINPSRPVGEHSGCLGRIPVTRVTVREVLSDLCQTKTTQILVFMVGKICPKRYMTSKRLAP